MNGILLINICQDDDYQQLDSALSENKSLLQVSEYRNNLIDHILQYDAPKCLELLIEKHDFNFNYQISRLERLKNAVTLPKCIEDVDSFMLFNDMIYKGSLKCFYYLFKKRGCPLSKLRSAIDDPMFKDNTYFTGKWKSYLIELMSRLRMEKLEELKSGG